jgi:protein FRA10AC1
MSWRQAGGRVVSGPPTASGSSNSNDRRFKQNTGGLNAFQREQQFAAHYGRHDTQVEERGRTDWDVLKENHRFIRDDEDSGDVTWEERLARAYESKLFKEFALVSPPPPSLF